MVLNAVQPTCSVALFWNVVLFECRYFSLYGRDSLLLQSFRYGLV